MTTPPDKPKRWRWKLALPLLVVWTILSVSGAVAGQLELDWLVHVICGLLIAFSISSVTYAILTKPHG